MEKRDYNIRDIASHFQFEGKFIGGQTYGTGHINDTYALQYEKDCGCCHRYILQRINHLVFTRPEQLMSNVELITGHMRNKIEAYGGDVMRETLNIVPTLDGTTFYQDPDGLYWRGYVFIENARTYDVVASADHFHNAGRTFGRFQQMLSDFPVDKLYDTIADFHNTSKRYENFQKAVEENTANRKHLVQSEIDFLMNREQDMHVVVNMLDQGLMPTRVTHNDTKFNNIMIDDATGEGICVIDLDTVMRGSALYDFGDSIRSGTNTGLEDEVDLSKVNFDINLFEVFTRGYMESAGDALTEQEIDLLAFSGKLITMEIGMRFLTDYLNGDIYFKIHREHQNLDRARTQFKMVMDMESQMDEMNRIVRSYI